MALSRLFLYVVHVCFTRANSREEHPGLYHHGEQSGCEQSRCEQARAGDALVVSYGKSLGIKY